MYKTKYLLLLLLSFVQYLSAQSLDEYLRLGLETNRQLAVDRSSETVAGLALDEAQRLKSLRLDFSPTYTLAAGGRVIAVPIGDLLNPVYSTLNTLTASDQFPQVENAEELLNPNNFYDVKVKATYPIINRTIGVNEQIKSLELSIASQEINRTRLQLGADIAAAYYDHQMANDALSIYREAMDLVKESLRLNRGLLDQGLALPIDVRAAQNDSVQLAKDIANADLMRSQAAAYLNFLVNKPLDSPVEMIPANQELPDIPANSAAQRRPELAQLEMLGELNGRLGDLANAQAGPQLNAFADVGFQDFGFNFSGQTPYVFAGLSFSLNLYDGGQTKTKQKLAKAQQAETSARREAVAQQIELEVFTVRQGLLQSMNGYQAQERESIIRDQQYQDQLKRYRAGTINYIEVQQARNELITARLQRNIIRYRIWKEVADFKRALGLEQ